MQSSLIPERPLVISPTLAATIGLDEAVMLHVLSELIAHRPVREKDRFAWIELDQDQLLKAFPFWALIDIKRVQKSLLDLGLILIDPVTGNPDSHWFAINQTRPAPEPAKRQIGTGLRSGHTLAADQPMRGGSEGPGATYMPAHWQPGEDWIRQCRQQNIPEDFVRQLVPGFVMYWRERGQARFSWGNAFYKFVLGVASRADAPWHERAGN